MSEMLIIDRFEDGKAICETEQRTFISLEKCMLPPDIKEGDVLRDSPDGYVIDIQETHNRREQVLLRLRKIKSRQRDEPN